MESARASTSDVLGFLCCDHAQIKSRFRARVSHLDYTMKPFVSQVPHATAAVMTHMKVNAHPFCLPLALLR